MIINHYLCWSLGEICEDHAVCSSDTHLVHVPGVGGQDGAAGHIHYLLVTSAQNPVTWSETIARADRVSRQQTKYWQTLIEAHHLNLGQAGLHLLLAEQFPPVVDIFNVTERSRQLRQQLLPLSRVLVSWWPADVLQQLLHEYLPQQQRGLGGVHLPLELGVLCDEGQWHHAGVVGDEDSINITEGKQSGLWGQHFRFTINWKKCILLRNFTEKLNIFILSFMIYCDFKYWTRIFLYLEWWQFLLQWHLSTLGHTSHCYEQDDDESSPPRGEASSAWMVRCPDHSPAWWRACWTGGWNMVHWGWMRDCTLSWFWWLCYVLFTFISEKFIQNYFII